MSSTIDIDYKKFSVAQLLATRTSIDEAIMSLSGGSSRMPAAKAEKAKRVKRQGGPSAWGDWTKKMTAEHDAEIKAYKEANPNQLAHHLKWISANMGKTSQEWLSFKAEWDAAHPKPVKGAKSDSDASEASDGEAEQGEVAAPSPVAAPASKKRGPKKLADMTPEERAKHDAGVAERKAKKAAGATALEAAAKANLPIMIGGGSVATPAAAAVAMPASPVAAEEDEDGIELRIIKIDGQNYMRPWSSSANDWATTDLWYTNKKGEKAAYWGELMEDGSVNADAEEPTFD